METKQRGMMMVEMNRFGNRPAALSSRSRSPESVTVDSVFVYGTLKRGECRQPLWPATPLRIEAAWTLGSLFARGDYPAMTAGHDRVLGERWKFDRSDMPQVIAALDRIEGANQPGQPDLYRRVTIELFALTGLPLTKAFGYHYATDPTSDGFDRLRPSSPENFVQWP